MKYRGLDPGTRAVRWALAAIALGIVIGATGPAALRGIADAAALQHDALPWYASRILAILAYLALAASVVYGLLLSTKLLDAVAHRPISFALHQDLAAVGLGLAGIHGALLALDRTVPMSLLQLAVPFAAPYRALWVGAGQTGFYVMLAVVASFYVRRHIGQRAWRLLHYATFLSFAGATAHGIMAGSDSGTAWAWWMYAGATVTVVFLFAYRVVTGISIARARRARAPGAADTDPASTPRPVAVRRAA